MKRGERVEIEISLFCVIGEAGEGLCASFYGSCWAGAFLFCFVWQITLHYIHYAI